MSRCGILFDSEVSSDLPVVHTGTQFIVTSKLGNFRPSGYAYLYEQFGVVGGLNTPPQKFSVRTQCRGTGSSRFTAAVKLYILKLSE